MIARLKNWLGCRFGFHRWDDWEWDGYVGVPESRPLPAQHRVCLDCDAVQGPLVSSEERRYYESRRDR